jgi:hypothetical protein
MILSGCDACEMYGRRKLRLLPLLLIISVVFNIFSVLEKLLFFDTFDNINAIHNRYASAFVNLKDFEYLTLSNQAVNNNNSYMFHPIKIRLSNLEVNHELRDVSIIKRTTLDVLQRMVENEMAQRGIKNNQSLRNCKYDTESTALRGESK